MGLHRVRVSRLVGHGVRVGVHGVAVRVGHVGVRLHLLRAGALITRRATSRSLSLSVLRCSLLLIVVRVCALLRGSRLSRRRLVPFVSGVATRHRHRRRHHVVGVRVGHHAAKICRHDGLTIRSTRRGASVERIRIRELGRHARVSTSRLSLRLRRRLTLLLLLLLHTPARRGLLRGRIKSKAEITTSGRKVTKLKSQVLRLLLHRLLWAGHGRRLRRGVEAKSKAIGGCRLRRRLASLLRGLLRRLRRTLLLLLRHWSLRHRSLRRRGLSAGNLLGPVHRLTRRRAVEARLRNTRVHTVHLWRGLTSPTLRTGNAAFRGTLRTRRSRRRRRLTAH
mmetsp:Transcript_5706/g.20681  ORF Transcript_5706/g.20681 Transcript_5706/m.20681 type:complete len:336 (+) Transcript_5706:419-1426(+)